MAESSDTDSSNKEIEEEDENISDQENGSEVLEKELDINASSTESDDDETDDKDEEENPSPPTKSLTRTELVIENLVQKYNERQGKQLFVRFPEKLPADENEFQQKVEALSPLVVLAHKPRQKYARFCLVDFSSTEDRDVALKSIQAAIVNDKSFHGIVVSLPRTEKKEYLQELVEKKRNSIEIKKTRQRLKRESKKALRLQNFTSSIVISNLPKSASIAEVRKNFSNAVDIHIKPGRGKLNGASIATITLPSTKDASAAVKQKVSLGNTDLIIRFDTKKLLHNKNNQKRKSTEDINQSPAKKKTSSINCSISRQRKGRPSSAGMKNFSTD